MRNISFALTTLQVIAGTKDVTRRTGWANLKPGTRLQGVRKAQGLKKGEQVERLRVIEVVDVRREPLRRLIDDSDYGRQEVVREGFPTMTPMQFVVFFMDDHDCALDDLVTRIEFRYVDA